MLDDAEAILVVAVVDALGNRVTAEPDYRVLAPWKVTDEMVEAYFTLIGDRE